MVCFVSLSTVCVSVWVVESLQSTRLLAVPDLISVFPNHVIASFSFGRIALGLAYASAYIASGAPRYWNLGP